jgi:tripartite-type tricarboxylate transporter receptor subunit TctC
MRTFLLAIVAATALLAPVTPRAEPFYQGKTITYIVATKPGGGYDVYARLIAEYMEKYLPGAKVRVSNVPGAGHIVGTNQLYVADPDGLTIGTFNTGLIYAQLLGSEGVRFDLRKLSWIGKAASDPRCLLVSEKSGLTSVADLQASKDPILFGSSGVGTTSHNESMLLAYVLDFPIKVIAGFSGNEAQLSMMRGEIAASFSSYSSLRPFVENRYGRFIAHVGGDGVVEADIPAARDMVRGEDKLALISLMEALCGLARLTAAPPGVPADRLEVLRTAYRRALEDPKLLERAAKLQIPIVSLYGEDVAARVAAALDQPAGNLAIVTEILGPAGND